jgi:hypothetical protein
MAPVLSVRMTILRVMQGPWRAAQLQQHAGAPGNWVTRIAVTRGVSVLAAGLALNIGFPAGHQISYNVTKV